MQLARRRRKYKRTSRLIYLETQRNVQEKEKKWLAVATACPCGTPLLSVTTTATMCGCALLLYILKDRIRLIFLSSYSISPR